MDPWSDSYVIFLSNRNYPDRRPNTIPLEGKLANAAAQALDIQIPESGREISRLTGYNESLTDMRRWRAVTALSKQGSMYWRTRICPLAKLEKKHGGHLRVGILSNQTGLDSHGRRTIDVLFHDAPAKVPGLKVTTLFSPEHGITGKMDTTDISGSTDAATGLPVVSM